MKFTYSSGQRPLDGYTLKRGIGRGGFGEVYFAVSDGGKELAVKLLRDNQDIELRGVVQCLNLKHPNLVALYDLKTDARGDRWVLMEYVAGESLSAVLNRHPEGLPIELTREWFLALCKAISYLHDHGIVHRDLKPANLFLENGVIKVGDYGLSKSISGSQRTAQTQSIGTVHYMAPEISTGNYNKQIDVYAAGIILYEMLTGHVPFDGESVGEVLMKHLTSPPDLSRVPKDYEPIVARALSKNPVQRFVSLAEMARAVEAIGGPPTPTAQPIRPAPINTPPRVMQGISPNRPPSDPETPSGVIPTPGGTTSELCGSLLLAVFFSALATGLWAALAQTRTPTDLGAVFFLTVSASWAILIPTKFWKDGPEDAWSRRLIMLGLGAALGANALWLEGWVMAGYPMQTPTFFPVATFGGNSELAAALSYLSYFAIVFLALRWWKMTDRRRSQRFSFAPVLATGFWALVLLLIWQHLKHGAVALVLASAIVQLVSPWQPSPPPAARRLRLRYH